MNKYSPDNRSGWLSTFQTRFMNRGNNVAHSSLVGLVVAGMPISSMMLLVIAVLVPLVMLTFTHVSIVDDAYISFRYSLNLANGSGLVFNTGERVEGMTNLLWTLLMSVPLMLALPVHVAAVVVGLVFGMLAVLDAWRLCSYLGIRPWPVFAVLLVIGLLPNFWLAITNGLEGGLFAFLLMRTIYTTVSGGSPYVSGTWGGLLFLTRPESVVVVPLCALYQFVAPQNADLCRRRVITSRIVPLLVPWMSIVIGVTAWRLSYYGSWLPNSISAKWVPGSKVALIWSNVLPGLGYLKRFLISSWILTVGMVLAPLLAPRRPVVWLCVAVFAAELPAVIINGGDWMPNLRLLSVYAPLLAVVLAVTLERFDTSLFRFAPLGRMTLRMILVILLMGGIFLTLYGNRQAVQNAGGWKARPSIEINTPAPCYQLLANALEPALLPTDRVSSLVLGIFSYTLADFYSHDMIGLTDAHVARHGDFYWPRIGKSDFAYSYQQVRPTVAVLHRYGIPSSALPEVSAGQYKDEYVVYARDAEPDCHELIVIRRDSLDRVLAALQNLSISPLK